MYNGRVMGAEIQKSQGESVKIDRRKFNKGNEKGSNGGGGRKTPIERLASEEAKKKVDELFLDLAVRFGLPYLQNVLSGIEEVPPEIKFKCNKEVLDRAFGKPKETHALTDENGKTVGVIILPGRVAPPEENAGDTLAS